MNPDIIKQAIDKYPNDYETLPLFHKAINALATGADTVYVVKQLTDLVNDLTSQNKLFYEKCVCKLDVIDAMVSAIKKETS